MERQEKPLGILDAVILVLLAVSIIMFFIGVSNVINLNEGGEIILAAYLLIAYVLIWILLTKLKNAILNFYRKKTIPKPIKEIKIIEKPVEKVVTKRVYVEKKEKPKPKFKYYGSSLQNTYHLEKCRFSGMIKPEHLILRNTNTYFKKNKFHACKNCMPNRK